MLELKPDVVVTFGPDGAYGHPDHIAISQLTTAACIEAARRGHSVSKLYYFAETKALALRYAEIFGVSRSTVDGVERLFEGLGRVGLDDAGRDRPGAHADPT